jgi:hypothetical protein
MRLSLASPPPACVALSPTRILRPLHPSERFIIGLLSAYQGGFIARNGDIAMDNQIVRNADLLKVRNTPYFIFLMRMPQRIVKPLPYTFKRSCRSRRNYRYSDERRT